VTNALGIPNVIAVNVDDLINHWCRKLQIVGKMVPEYDDGCHDVVGTRIILIKVSITRQSIKIKKRILVD